MRVLVNIKDTPDFVVRRTATPSLLPLLLILASYGALNKRHRSSVALIDVDDNLVSIAPPPKLEVSVLGALPLYEDE
jgi:hypothetical protein